MTISPEQHHLLQTLQEEHWAPLHRLVVDHGVGFDPAPLPSDIEPGEQNCCFHNAFTLASREPSRYTYFEGFATYSFPTAEGPERSWPIRHAWCVADSLVVDPTWRESRTLQPLAYRGVALPLQLAAPFATKHSHGPLHHYAQCIEVVYVFLGLEQPRGEDRDG